MGDKSYWHKNDSYKRASATCDEQHYQTDVASAWHCARLVLTKISFRHRMTETYWQMYIDELLYREQYFMETDKRMDGQLHDCFEPI